MVLKTAGEIELMDEANRIVHQVLDEIAATLQPGVTTKERGWGVGLALTRRIVEGVHSGRIALGDDGSSGATFHIRLPIQQPSTGS